jgi:exopolyphosphatase/guanosine-5'-triphosphate,3'-diphosphate pyrophosphatase
VTRVGAIDCGTNTIKLLVADLDAATGAEHQLVREMRIVRLGQDVDRTGRLADEAVARTLAAVDEYAAILEAHHVDVLRFCATSASRDASNAAEFRAAVTARLGVEPEVVSGDEEAALSYDGATRSLRAPDGAGDLGDLPRPFLVVDIGGGSTELVLGRADDEGVEAARSLDIGSVRLTERLMPSDPPTAAEVEAATEAIDAALDTLPGFGVDLARAGTVVGVAGTVTTVAVLLAGLDHWDREVVHHAVFPVGDVHALTERLLGMTTAEREALHVPRGRADVIATGALVLDRVLRRTPVDSLLVSDADILDGIAWSQA